MNLMLHEARVTYVLQQSIILSKYDPLIPSIWRNWKLVHLLLDLCVLKIFFFGNIVISKPLETLHPRRTFFWYKRNVFFHLPVAYSMYSEEQDWGLFFLRVGGLLSFCILE